VAWPAVKSPLLVIVPPVAAHVTPVLEFPVTVAENCWGPPGWTVALVGAIAMETAGADSMVTAATAVLLVSATEVAVTVKLLLAIGPAV
jgi:hypothetical protein